MSNNDARNVLLGARWLLADPARWTQNSYIKDDRCCVLGALKLSGAGQDIPIADALDALYLHVDSVIDFNDAAETTHADAIALLDKAIESC